MAKHITVASQQNNYTGRQSTINQIHFFKSKRSKGERKMPYSWLKVSFFVLIYLLIFTVVSQQYMTDWEVIVSKVVVIVS